MTTAIQIIFTPRKKEYTRASRALTKKTKSFLILAVVLLVLLLISIFILLLPSFKNTSWYNVAVVFFIIGAFFFVYYLVLIPIQLGKAYDRTPFLKSEREFTFTDAEIIMKVGDTESTLDWDKLKRVIEDQEIFLLAYQADQLVYPFIPKRAFSDSGSEENFRQFIINKSIRLI